MDSLGDYQNVTVRAAAQDPKVFIVSIAREEQKNAIDGDTVLALARAVSDLARGAAHGDCRAIVLAGEGPCFSAGIDFALLAEISADAQQRSHGELARAGLFLREAIQRLQDLPDLLEEIHVPVVAVAHSHCIGLGLELILAADVRIASSCARFALKETQLGLAADVGGLSRLPRKCSNDSWVSDITMTARTFGADEALRNGLVSEVCESRQAALELAVARASAMAALSPVAVAGTKRMIRFARDSGADARLDREFVATWNMAAIQGEDLMKAVVSRGKSGGYAALPKLSKI